MINTLKNNSSSISNLLVLIFWIFLIFLFLNELFGDKNYPEKDSFENTRKNSKIIVYNFNTNWCGYSKRFQPIWDRFSESVTNTDIETVDVREIKSPFGKPNRPATPMKSVMSGKFEFDAAIT
jgi:thiol-disulfide isomerase/thioredoxin